MRLALTFVGPMSQGSMEGIVRSVFLVCALFVVFPVLARAATDGESTYKEQCLKCHGPNGDGNGHTQMKIKPADLRSDAVQQRSDEELYKAIAYGVGHKEYAHAFAARGLSSKQIADVVKYIRKFAKTEKKQN